MQLLTKFLSRRWLLALLTPVVTILVQQLSVVLPVALTPEQQVALIEWAMRLAALYIGGETIVDAIAASKR
jgi:hypothetical protein